MEKLIQIVAIIFTAFFSLLTGNAMGHLQYEQAIRFGAAGIAMLIIALVGVFDGRDNATAKDNPLQESSPQDRP